MPIYYVHEKSFKLKECPLVENEYETSSIKSMVTTTIQYGKNILNLYFNIYYIYSHEEYEKKIKLHGILYYAYKSSEDYE